MADTLSACFVGLGSIGKRHLANLHTVAKERGLTITVEALRHDNAIPLDVHTLSLLNRELFRKEDLGHYDLMFICNPSQLHYETLRHLNDRANRFFIEKPVFTTALTADSLQPFEHENKYYIACPLRHTKTFATLKEFVEQNPVYAVRAICSSYLPDWRPAVDYRTLYSATADSGGVAVDLIHEFDYLLSLFGMPEKSKLVAQKVSHLEIASNDVAAFLAQYPDKMLELHLDYFGRTPQRYCEVYTKECVRRFDFLSETGSPNDKYLAEMNYFMDFACKRVPNINPISFANSILATATRWQ